VSVAQQRLAWHVINISRRRYLEKHQPAMASAISWQQVMAAL
jgi:hypothetical protein